MAAASSAVFEETVAMARLRDIVFDCEQPAALARFWAAALDEYEVAPYDDDELARLRSLGVEDLEDDPSVLLRSEDDAPRIWFQRVPEARSAKNRVHLDVSCVDHAVEHERLVDLDARPADDQPNPDLIVMHDPEGNEFCLLRS